MKIENDETILLSKTERHIYERLCTGKTQTAIAFEFKVSRSYINQITKNLISVGLLKKIPGSKKGEGFIYEKSNLKLKIEENIKIPPSHSRCRICNKKIKRGRKYCSQQCRGIHQRGERSPAWKGGKSFVPYCPKFNDELKERVRIFFQRKCFLCGCDEKITARLAVHHVHYKKNACCDNKEGPVYFVPLCERCHNITTPITKREFWEEVISNQLMERTGGKCYISKSELRELIKKSS